ncbi:vancomycin high temperature exclusion protein [Slackia heliotrinireducens]|uniref:Uncharacterized membrane protein n=1 Tax=Slackia heliotrinireducens (strain ATCC 29202 / DSM 20476 / NCTC 11029 / RHS 1) TaxID=471855 RepID=C7N3Z7_SLAHD|nr:ElyC/SanA/YdcF family protein [Slackia heliotrinireducens]ACV21738.1 uncharacterized membrane protein [Slackia heliotrinireducens DSM 20476]VEG99385.1 vancomycin high temperature exclusion protein [Slackia heliotrinireducens]
MVKGFLKFLLALLIAAVVVVGGLNAWVVMSATTDDYTLEQAQELDVQAECIVVLGASVLPDGTPSDILKGRLDAAIALYESGAAPVIVMSGNGTESNYDEPFHMKQYAIEQGVPADAIVLDRAGYHTYDTMWRLANIYGADSCIVITQEYHLYRSVFDAKSCGMDAVGVVSDNGTYNDQLWYDVREVASRCHDGFLALAGAAPENQITPFEY